MPRTRQIPSMFRTAGRLYRWNRRFAHRRGEPESAVTREQCVAAVNTMRKVRARLNR